jgi:hypothetical protein
LFAAQFAERSARLQRNLGRDAKKQPRMRCQAVRRTGPLPFEVAEQADFARGRHIVILQEEKIVPVMGQGCGCGKTKRSGGGDGKK